MDEQQKLGFITRSIRFIRRHFRTLLIIVIVLVLVGTYELGRASVYRAHPELTSTEQAMAILKKVGDLIQLPQEQPTMATINDAASAKKTQPFLQNAANGDVLIVYPNASEALLYRPSSNKLIAVGPVDNSAQGASIVKNQSSESVATSTNNNATKSNTSNE